MADFILLGQGDNGSWALSSDKTRLFSLAIGTYLDVICEAFNNQAIPRLIDLNEEHFKGITDYPRMIHSDIDDRNLIELSTFLEKMVGIGLLMPDDQLEDFVRKEANMPERIQTDDMPEPEIDPEEKKKFRLDQAQGAKGGQNGPQDGENGDGKVNGPDKSKNAPDKPTKPSKPKSPDEEDIEKANAAKAALGR